MSAWKNILEDFEHSFSRRGSRRSVMKMVLLRPGFRAVALYRLGRSGRKKGMGWLGALAERLIHCLCRVDISTEADIAPGLAIPHAVGIVIGSRSRIGRRCRVLQGVTLGGAGKTREDGQTQPWVGDDCTLGAGAKLLGPVRIGDRCTVGANAVVTQNVSDDSLVVGVPGRVIRRGGQPVPLAEQEGELARTVRDLIQRVAKLERQNKK